MNSNGHKERPILFSSPMVRAILEGRKTQTRRVVGFMCGTDFLTHRKDDLWILSSTILNIAAGLPRKKVSPRTGQLVRCPYGKPGDRLWVRETWADVTLAFQSHECEEPQVIAFQADDAVYNTRTMHFLEYRNDSGIVVKKWRPSIFLPRPFSRITLEITNVRVERLQEISEADIRAEGVDESTIDELANLPNAHREPSLLEAWCHGWDALNGKRGYGWASNPWVWVIEFKVL